MGKVNLILIPMTELKPLITMAFQGDDELLRNLTPIKNDMLENCVNRIYGTISGIFSDKVYSESENKVFKVELDGEAIGYIVVAINDEIPNELFSFGININYRSKEIVLQWLKEVKWILGKFFWIALYKQNERAINFFERNGFTKQEEENRSFVMLLGNHQEYMELVKHKEVCQ